MALNTPQNTQRSYRRGAVMGITMAEAFVLICFALLLLFAFWQWEVEQEQTPQTEKFKQLNVEQQVALLEKNPPHIETFSQLPPQTREIIVDSVTDGSFAEFLSLKESGVKFSEITARESSEGKWRFIPKKDAQRLWDAASALPDDVKRDLAELVETRDVKEILQQLKILEDLVKKGNSLEDISTRIALAESQRATLAITLQKELGPIVSKMGGTFDTNGAIILPDSVLFETGSFVPKANLIQFLSKACEPWLTTLKNAQTPISEIRIEGHASSEWALNSTQEEAYLGNLTLSGQRSEVVLRQCLDFVQNPDLREWARKHLVAVGYSSTRPILNNGVEDKSASRRVVFVAIPDRKTLIDDIENEVKKGGAGYDRTLFSGPVSAQDICSSTRRQILVERSKSEVTLSWNTCNVLTGQWRDAYTGETATQSEDLEIDHLVPLKWAWVNGAKQWPAERRAQFYNDPKNLRITHKKINREKGARSPINWLPPAVAQRCTYLTDFQDVLKAYDIDGFKTELDELRLQLCR